MQGHGVAIAATFTAEPIEGSLSFFLRGLGIESALEFAPYNQIFQQLLDPGGLFARNQRSVNLILVRLEDWAKYTTDESGQVVFPPEAPATIDRSADDLIGALRTAAARTNVPHVVMICPPSVAARAHDALSTFLPACEERLAANIEDIPGAYAVRLQRLPGVPAAADYDDPESSRLGHIPYTPDYFAALGSAAARSIYRAVAPPHKVIVLDCDNTLWNGICGEDGVQGISIDAFRRALQEFVVAQYEAGMLVCLCSRNNEADALEVFRHRDDMVLKLDHVLAWRINWRPKSENLKSLAAELNLGLDSFIFIDDDAAVCAEVRANCPQALTLLLPEPCEIPRFLQHVWAFDRGKRTKEDAQRTALYKQNLERDRVRQQSSSLQDFLEGLDLRIEISRLSQEDLPRVSQLTQRTNQFNVTTIRRSEAEIRKLCDSGAMECLTVKVSDRFGDYGLVGVTLFGAGKGAIEVDTFLLSCRALGRGVEHRMMAVLGGIALQRGLGLVNVAYAQTEKNRPALEFLRTVNARVETRASGEQVFAVAAECAAGVKPEFTSAKAEAVPQEDSAANRPASQPARSVSHEFLLRIATDLYDGERIAAALKAEAGERRTASPAEVTEAADEVEAGLQEIWEEVLGVQPISVTEDYFDLGGDSIRAVRIFSEIERRFGKHLPLVSLLSAPTIRLLAKQVRDDAGARWSPLVPIQPAGEHPPLYCMHAAGGNVLFYRDLAAHLGADQPVYGLQARGLDRSQTHHDRVEDMAAYYIEEIQAFQPKGPYYLCGSSFGGLVAFEMARQLEAMGEQVAFLGLFDTYGPGYPKPLPNSNSLRRRAYRWVERAQNVKDHLQLLEPADRLRYFVEKAAKSRRKLVRKFLWKRNEFAMKYNAATGRELPKDLQRNHKAIDNALRTYRPQVYSGRMTLFRASRQPLGIQPDPNLGWTGLAIAGIEVHEIPGSHGVVTVDPHARFLAEKLVPCLEAARTVSSTENHAVVPALARSSDRTASVGAGRV